MIYVVDTGANLEELTNIHKINFVWSPDNDFTDSLSHGTGMIRAIQQVSPESEIGVLKILDDQNQTSYENLDACLQWLLINLRPNDIVLWCFIMPVEDVPERTLNLLEQCLDLSTWVVPSGNFGKSTKEYYPAKLCLAKSNTFVIGCLNKSNKIAKLSNTPANGYVTGTTQPVGYENKSKSGTSVSAAYFAGMLDNPQDVYHNAINEVIQVKKI